MQNYCYLLLKSHIWEGRVLKENNNLSLWANVSLKDSVLDEWDSVQQSTT